MLLGVNIDHSATLRQARYKGYSRTCGQMVEPDPAFFAQLSERAGADGITIHLREDRRHIQEEDTWRVRACIQTRLNLEMACTEEMALFAEKLKPETVCLVPESREEVTTEGGLDVVGHRSRVQEIIQRMAEVGIATSLFIDAEPEQIALAAELKSPYIELHTGAFANAFYEPEKREAQLQRLIAGAEQAMKLGITVNAGHGINYVNIASILQIPHLHELNIGHSILCRALSTGIEEAVREMKRLMNP